MKTCKIEILNDLRGNSVYLAYLESTVIHPTGQVISSKLHEFRSRSKLMVFDFLKEHGVDIEEAKFAIDHMVEVGHNEAGFGMMGTFISSWYSGVNH